MLITHLVHTKCAFLSLSGSSFISVSSLFDWYVFVNNKNPKVSNSIFSRRVIHLFIYCVCVFLCVYVCLYICVSSYPLVVYTLHAQRPEGSICVLRHPLSISLRLGLSLNWSLCFIQSTSSCDPPWSWYNGYVRNACFIIRCWDSNCHLLLLSKCFYPSESPFQTH